jgi:ribosome biogenesis GTPase A
MNDIEEIYQCLLDKSYQDAIQLDILISKINDQELMLGFLFDLSIRHDEYESNKETIDLAISNIANPDELDTKRVMACHSKYIELLKAKNEESMVIILFSVSTLFMLLSGAIDAYNKTITECINKMALEKLKEQLLDAELYENIAVIDKRIKEIEDGRS